ncbi:MAG: pilus assembly protein TadG-related protein [Candidatus Hydrogenedentes bacterium]|nr:pilus assembly protein TadG-related protein [Candidatus Hydrogenedentota bacterium]
MKFVARNEGIASLWTVLLIVVFVVFVGLAIDTGYLIWIGQKLQIGADAAALGGAQRLQFEPALVRPAAINIALANSAAGAPIELRLNDSNLPDGDIVIGRFDRDTGAFDSTSDFPNAVMVQARRNGASLGGPVDLIFGRIMGIDTSNVGRRAIAIVGGGTGVGLLVLDGEGDCALAVRGDPYVDLADGAIIVK